MATDPDPNTPNTPNTRGPQAVGPIGTAPLAIAGSLGLVLGWMVRGWSLDANAITPEVSWIAVAATWFVTLFLAAVARVTWRVLHRDGGVIPPEQGVRRLVLAKTMAIVAALATGGFAGSAISFLGVGGEAAQGALLRGLLAAVGAAVGVIAALALERACRVPRNGEGSLP